MRLLPVGVNDSAPATTASRPSTSFRLQYRSPSPKAARRPSTSTAARCLSVCTGTLIPGAGFCFDLIPEMGSAGADRVRLRRLPGLWLHRGRQTSGPACRTHCTSPRAGWLRPAGGPGRLPVRSHDGAELRRRGHRPRAAALYIDITWEGGRIPGFVRFRFVVRRVAAAGQRLSSSTPASVCRSTARSCSTTCPSGPTTSSSFLAATSQRSSWCLRQTRSVDIVQGINVPRSRSRSRRGQGFVRRRRARRVGGTAGLATSLLAPQGTGSPKLGPQCDTGNGVVFDRVC